MKKLINFTYNDIRYFLKIVGLICSLFGGRPAMINGATGAFAAIISGFVKPPDDKKNSGEGVELLFLSVIVGGLLMGIFTLLRLEKFI